MGISYVEFIEKGDGLNGHPFLPFGVEYALPIHPQERLSPKAGKHFLRLLPKNPVSRSF